MKKFLLSIIAIALCFVSFSDSKRDKVEGYIKQYSQIAIDEMYRSGIPASITLAQAIIESGYGTSTLATEANNHFGIKCHSDWKGESIRHDDDEKNECFRKYKSAVDSFRDHSDFLRFKSRYAFLFDEFEINDYKSWAYGLKKAGYATNPQYAEILIKTIETYDLARFDEVKNVEKLPETPNELIQVKKNNAGEKRGTYSVNLTRTVFYQNHVPFIYAYDGETYESIAILYDLFPKELMRFNDDVTVDRRLNAGEPVYIASKPRYAAKGVNKHVCLEGETLRGIAQMYGVSLKSLMKLNHISEDCKFTLLEEDRTVLLRPERKKK